MTLEELLQRHVGDHGPVLVLASPQAAMTATVRSALGRLAVPDQERDGTARMAGDAPAPGHGRAVVVLDPHDTSLLAALPGAAGAVAVVVVDDDPAHADLDGVLDLLASADQLVTGADIVHVGDHIRLALVVQPATVDLVVPDDQIQLTVTAGDRTAGVRALGELVLARALARGAVDSMAPRGVPSAGRAGTASLVRDIAWLSATAVSAQRRAAGAVDELRRVKSSPSWAVGRAVAVALRSPRAGVPGLSARIRAALGGPAAAGGGRPGRPVRPPAGSGRGKRRRFSLALPSGPAGMRTALDFDVPADRYVPAKLERDGLAGYEPETLACYLAAIEVGGPGDVWDVGANVGIYSLLARALSGRRVHAFEPTPDLVETARAVAAANDLDYDVHQLAAGRQAGTATLYLSGNTDSSNSLAAGFRASRGELVVPVEPLDSWSRRIGSIPAVIKIDTETTEPEVLAGGRDVVLAHRPWILCEVLANRTEKRLMEVIGDWGYLWYPIGDEMPYDPRDTIVGDPTFTHSMYLFAPQEPSATFWDAARRWRVAIDLCGPGVHEGDPLTR